MGAEQVMEFPTAWCYEVLLRPHTDIRSPAPGFIAALAGEFERAVDEADGLLCLTVSRATAGDDTAEAAERVLNAAAARHESTSGGWVRVDVTGTRYTPDGRCHVLAHCETADRPDTDADDHADTETDADDAHTDAARPDEA